MGLSYGFKFLHGLLTNKNKNSGKKLISDTHLLAPCGAIFRFFSFFVVENMRRRSVRVMKLHRGFILTKKGDINKLVQAKFVEKGGIFNRVPKLRI